MKIEVSIFTEGGKGIGLGHVTRCYALAQSFSEIKIIRRIKLIINSNSRMALEKAKKISFLNFNWLNNKKKVLFLTKKSDILIVDSYLAPKSFYNMLHTQNKHALLAAIDDFGRIDYGVDLLINPSDEGMHILRRDFWDVPKKKIKNIMGRIVVTFGWEDKRNITPQVLEYLNENYPDLQKRIIIGGGFRSINIIKNLKDSRTELIFCPKIRRLRREMLSADVAISAGGQSLYELARTGVPTIAIPVAENQLFNIQGCEKKGFVKAVNLVGDKIDINRLNRELKVLSKRDAREAMEYAARESVDGRGASRIADFCVKKFFEKNISIRKAKASDLYKIYKLSNEREVRQNSFNQGNIKLKSHRRWFLDKTKDKNCLFLVAFLRGELIGQVRFDIRNIIALISISISKGYRGLGLGSFIFKESVKVLKKCKPRVKTIKALIRNNNTQSINFFKGLGFIFGHKTKIGNTEALQYRYVF